MSETTARQPGERFQRIFRALMVFCVLVWLWGLGLYMIWPWDKGGEWLPEFPIVVTCADNSACALPFRELAEAKSSGRISALHPPIESGETAYGQLHMEWQPWNKGMETKVSAWNFQITVRYALIDEQPVLVEYREISGKLFLVAILGALLTLFGLYRNQLKR